MEAQVMLLRESTPAAELAARAISSVVNGEVDPITAHINISRMEAAIKLFKENTYVRDITLRELAKYGKSHQFGDCRLEEAESGVKYDYSMCGDSRLNDMYKTLEALKVDIKEREEMLPEWQTLIRARFFSLQPVVAKRPSKPLSKSNKQWQN